MADQRMPDRERVLAEGKKIFINALERHTDLNALVHQCSWLLRNPNAKEILLIFEQNFRVLPNMMAPLAALLAFLHKVNVKPKIYVKHPTLQDCSVFEPRKIEGYLARSDPSNVVWAYSDSKELESLISAVIEDLYLRVPSESQVLLALEYCMGELMDNVLRHSKASAGYFMYTLQNNGERIALSVADQGIGVLRSFEHSSYRPMDAADAITLAMTKGITSSSESAGNGLWSSSEIITHNNGQFTLTSSGGAIYYDKSRNKVTSYDRVPTLQQELPGMHIDFQLDFSVPIDFNAIWQETPSPINTRLENLEDSADNLVLKLAERTFGTSTRESAREMRVLAMNYLRTQNQPVVLDFTGLSIISSSYADELVVKSRLEARAMGCADRLGIAGTCSTVDLIIADAIGSRVEP